MNTDTTMGWNAVFACISNEKIGLTVDVTPST